MSFATLEDAEKEITKLRDENAKARIKNNELATENANLKAERDQAVKDKDESNKQVIKLTDDLKKMDTDNKAAIETMSKDHSGKLILAELKAVAVKQGLVDPDILKLADLSKLKFDDKGNLEGADDLLKALKESKPYAFGKPVDSTTGQHQTPGKDKDEKNDAMKLSATDYKAALAEAIKKAGG